MIRKVLLIISASLFFAIPIFAQDMATDTKTTASTTKKPAVFRPTKDQIKKVQTMLKDKKLYTGEASGTYNDDTRSGIKSFQKDNGLTQTGTLNRATLEKFGVELTDSQKLIPVSESSIASSKSKESNSKPAKPDTPSSSGVLKPIASAQTESTVKKPAPFRAGVDQVKAAQKVLKDGKMYTGEETGKLDDATRAGLTKYQGANSLKATGTLNAATLEKMGITLTDAQKANVAAQAAYDAARKN
ncbi:hypothetical protein BH10ACI2_BH10ACI2_05590 [soil metagenome]